MTEKLLFGLSQLAESILFGQNESFFRGNFEIFKKVFFQIHILLLKQGLLGETDSSVLWSVL
jgi:hypothetical protein